jgi:nucleotide-binding universal stress UspA family protein
MYGEIVIADDGHGGGRDCLAFAELLRGPGTTLVSAHDLARRATVHRLHALAAERGSDLLIVGAHHARAAVYNAPCQVAVVPRGYAGRPYRAIRSIGIGHTDTPEGRAVLDVARALAWEPLDSGGGWKAVAAAQRMSEIPGVRGVAFEGDVMRELAHFARVVDLLMLGSHHHGAARRLMRGDVAGGLTGHSPSPLLVV